MRSNTSIHEGRLATAQRRRRARHRLVATSGTGTGTGMVGIGIVCVRTWHTNTVEYMIRAEGRDGTACSVVFASLERLSQLRAELHAAGVAEAATTPFYIPPSAEQSIENQIALLDAWLAAQLSCNDPRATPVLARFLPVPSYLSLVHATPSPSPAWIHDGRVRRGVRARPTQLQAAQRRLAYAMLVMDTDDGEAEAEAGEQTWLTPAVFGLLCTDLHEQVGRSIAGLHYPRTHPTPEALVKVLQRRARVAAQARNGQKRAQQCLASEGVELQRLIDAGADVNGKTEFMDTPLKAAASAGDTTAIQLLLDAKASVDDCGQTYSQRTPLMLAALKSHERAMELLLDHGADVTLASSDGTSVVDVVTANYRIFSERMHARLGLLVHNNIQLSAYLVHTALHAISQPSP